MQAVSMNGVMSAFKSPSLSPPSAELAQTLGKMEARNSVYEISATTSSPVTAVNPLTDMEDKYRLEQEMLPYSTQYYSNLEAQSRASSPGGVAVSPKDSAGNLTPVSVSSKDSSSSSDVTSVLEEEGGEAALGHQGMCIPISLSQEQGEEGTSSTQIKHWTYEDQFKQLYNLSPDPDRKEFLDKLFHFMQNKGTPITRVPIMAKQPLDLYKLFKLVVERGGLVEVIKKKAWRNVAKELNLPASITSAAFTMRSQYVKYLYPYECETAKLSEPQELQMAIDSNKRDRRHSDNLDFMSAPAQLVQREMESSLNSPVVTTMPQGLQLISSPTMALPHASVPPYSGGFIVTGGPGGAHMVASPQLVQMTHQGIPIVMPTPTIPVSTPSQPHPPPLSSQSQASSEDREDVQSHDSRESAGPPPAKRPALQEALKVGTNRAPYSIHQTSTGNFLMTHGGGVASPQLIHMGGPGQLPIVIPTGALSTALREGSTAMPHHINGKADLAPKSEAVHLPSHPAGSVLLNQRGSPAVSNSTRSLLQMAHHPHNLPSLIIPGPTLSSPQNGEKRKTEQDKQSNPATVKMPFANISIQSAGGKTEGEESSAVDASLLVTLEINNTVYQGVLFAKPQSVSSPQR